jgi:excisionase family DNA binding protein
VRKFLKVQEVATLLSVCRATVYRLLDEGRLQRVWVGASIRVPESSLAAYLEVLSESDPSRGAPSEQS